MIKVIIGDQFSPKTPLRLARGSQPEAQAGRNALEVPLKEVTWGLSTSGTDVAWTAHCEHTIPYLLYGAPVCENWAIFGLRVVAYRSR